MHYSAILRDQMTSPIASATWLLEHVINTKGAIHLKMSSRHLTLWSYLGLDILVFVCTIISLSLILIIKIYLCCKNKSITKQSKLKVS